MKSINEDEAKNDGISVQNQASQKKDDGSWRLWDWSKIHDTLKHGTEEEKAKVWEDLNSLPEEAKNEILAWDKKAKKLKGKRLIKGLIGGVAGTLIGAMIILGAKYGPNYIKSATVKGVDDEFKTAYREILQETQDLDFKHKKDIQYCEYKGVPIKYFQDKYNMTEDEVLKRVFVSQLFVLNDRDLYVMYKYCSPERYRANNESINGQDVNYLVTLKYPVNEEIAEKLRLMAGKAKGSGGDAKDLHTYLHAFVNTREGKEVNVTKYIRMFPNDACVKMSGWKGTIEGSTPYFTYDKSTDSLIVYTIACEKSTDKTYLIMSTPERDVALKLITDNKDYYIDLRLGNMNSVDDKCVKIGEVTVNYNAGGAVRKYEESIEIVR